MLKVEHIETYGWEAAFRGMRNPKNSWDKGDSYWDYDFHTGEKLYEIGDNDMKLAYVLAHGGPVHGKFLRMIGISMDITAPLFWWKEFDTYKVGTVRNSCSTMHKIMSKEFELSDFSYDRAVDSVIAGGHSMEDHYIKSTISVLNALRDKYLEATAADDKEEAQIVWRTLIEFLPSSYNQKATVTLNYEVARGMYFYRRNHKLIEWHEFCDNLEDLPYAKEFIMEGYKCQP